MPGIARRLVLLFVLALAGCASDAPRFAEIAPSLPPAPPGEARFFIYRPYDLSQSLAWVPVSLNGQGVGAVGPGQVIMRDVPAGTYRIEAKSEGLWPEQAKTVAVAPGQTVYAKIASFKGLNPTGNSGDVTLTTFVVMLVDAATARSEMGDLWFRAAEGRRAPAG